MEYFSSLLLDRSLLNKPDSTKKTFHLSLSAKDSPFSFEPGDSLAILPSNDPAKIDFILDWLNAPSSQEIIDPRTHLPISITDFLEKRANFGKITTKLKNALQIDPTNLLLDVEDALNIAPKSCLSPQELASHLLPLLPRFYSIASSNLMYPDEIHLLVAAIEYKIDDKVKKGVGSHFLCELAKPLITHIPAYVQPAKNFHLPPSSDAPIILIGPGTGVAPFRAFIQQRLSLHHSGKNWLFFGERNQQTDFYYEDFWKSLERQKKLKLSVAFSRDTSEKCYVQHRLFDAKKEIWEWIYSGAYIYVCGDASKMAKDVEAVFHQIFMEEGKLSEINAKAFFKDLRLEKRYLTDIY